MFESRNVTIVIVIVVLAVGIVIGTVMILSLTISQSTRTHYTPPPADCTEANNCAAMQFNGSLYELRGAAFEAFQEDCEHQSRCTLVGVNGTGYMLGGAAYQAYLDIDNVGVPLKTIRFESDYLPSQIAYLINIYGPSNAVESMAAKYNVTKSYEKIDYDDLITYYGWISKDNLTRFLDENNLDSLSAKSISVSRVTSYTVENETVKRIEFPIPEDKLSLELEAFRQDEIARIVNEKPGVTKLSYDDFFPVDESPKPATISVDPRCTDVLPNQVLVAKGMTFEQPFVVELSWNPYEMISRNGTADILVMMWDNRTSEPLEQVTYDFEYKGALDLGSIEDRYVGNFSNHPDTVQIPLKFPCDVHFTMRVDKVGERTFLRTDPEEIKQYGDYSPVLIQFRVSAEEGTFQVSMNLFNGRDLSGRSVPAE